MVHTKLMIVTSNRYSVFSPKCQDLAANTRNESRKESRNVQRILSPILPHLQDAARQRTNLHKLL